VALNEKYMHVNLCKNGIPTLQASQTGLKLGHIACNPLFLLDLSLNIRYKIGC